MLVEPRDGHELERLITALLNATGVVHQAVKATDDRPAVEGAEVIGVVADRLRGVLALLPEHHSDDELAVVTHVLAETTLLAANELGLDDCFRGE